MEMQQTLVEEQADTLAVEEALKDAAAQTAELAARLASEVSNALRDLLKLVPEERLKEACSSHGIVADEVVARTMAVMSKIEAAEQPRELASVTVLGAHRPAGTAAAAAANTADAKVLRLAQLESENASFKVQMRELGQICADAGVDLATDADSSAQSSAKRKKLGDLESAISRFGVA